MTTKFTIQGLHCGSCVARVKDVLQQQAQISSALVTLKPPVVVLESTATVSAEQVNSWLAGVGAYTVSAEPLPEKSVRTYRPLLILLSYLLTVVAIFAKGDWHTAMRLFMGGFFVAFSFFKMLDLAGFSQAYRGYDLIAKVIPTYGLVYPFLELGLGLAYLADWCPRAINLATAVLMAVSLTGVLKAVFSKQTIRCACLGTGFNLPMSTVTIVEDGVMLAMAVGALL